MKKFTVAKRFRKYKKTVYVLVGVLIALPYLAAGGYLLYKRLYRPQFTVGSAPRGGSYYKFASKLTDTLNASLSPWHKFEHRPTEGSEDNVAQIQQGTLDFALAQDGLTSSGPVRALARLYESPLHIAVRTNAGITNLSQLAAPNPAARPRIYLGPDRSGTRKVARIVLDHYGVKPSMFEDCGSNIPSASGATQRWDFNDAADALIDGHVDLAFFLVGVGSDAVRRLAAAPGVALLPIDRADGIVLAHPFLRKLVISNGSYEGLREFPGTPVPTVSTAELLVCSRNVPDTIAFQVTAALYEGAGKLMDDFGLLSQLSSVESSRSLYYRVHPGAEAYYKGKDNPGLFSWAEIVTAIGYSVSVFTAFRGFVRSLRARSLIDELDDVVESTGGLSSAVPVPHKLEHINQTMRRAVEHYINGRISSESFEQIKTYATWAEAILNGRTKP